MTSLTYVTAFMDIYTGNTDNSRAPYGRDIRWRFEKFADIAESGVQICVYTDIHGMELLKEYREIFPNIHIMEMADLTQTWVYKTYHHLDKLLGGNGGIQMPEHRTPEKDTAEYLLMMNAKIEFVKDAMEKNPFQSTHFAWVDFNISHIFHNITRCKEMMNIYACSRLSPSFLCLPGCFGMGSRNTDIGEIRPSLLEQINWRFCGGFFIGDRKSIEEFHELCHIYFPCFLMIYKKLVWEVNFWAWLERVVPTWNPNWFLSDHNDSIVDIPTDFYAVSLKLVGGGGGGGGEDGSYSTIEYNYPHIEGFAPCSASYLWVEGGTGEGTHILNTRYVNYTLTPEGYYMFHHPDEKIISKNIYSVLDDATMTPLFYREITDPIGFPSKGGGKIEGMEDIRLFCDGGEPVVKFTATSVNYSNTHYNRIISGIYDIDGAELKNCRVISPPNDNEWTCEKNWVPVGGGENRYVYRWSPFEIGEVGADNKLRIQMSMPVNSPICQKFRGSGIFAKGDDGRQVGVVHFSEGNAPRHYFHCLVMLDATGTFPVKYSQPFYFEKIGIEFCIGFCVKNGKYHFWISRFDRDPLLVVIGTNKIPVVFKYR